MANHDGCFRGFYALHDSYYARRMPERESEIMIGMYHSDGGTTGEFAIRWHSVGGRSVARLEAFHDSWSALARFGDFLAWLNHSDGGNPTPNNVCDALRTLGIVDRTDRNEPPSDADHEYQSWFAEESA